MEVLDKGKAAAVTSIVETRDASSGEVVYENQSTVFIRGAGGFGGKRAGKGRGGLSICFCNTNDIFLPLDRGAASATNEPPKRKPDTVMEEATTVSQAALYRLSGDWNPLHVGCLAACSSVYLTTSSVDSSRFCSHRWI
jgi:MaoC like domain